MISDGRKQAGGAGSPYLLHVDDDLLADFRVWRYHRQRPPAGCVNSLRVRIIIPHAVAYM